MISSDLELISESLLSIQDLPTEVKTTEFHLKVTSFFEASPFNFPLRTKRESFNSALSQKITLFRGHYME